MHELSISSAVVDTVVQHAAGRRVSAVTMTVGAFRQVVPESLEFYFGIVSRGTVCEGARLEQLLVPLRLGCSECGEEWEPELPAFRCPACAGSSVEVQRGDELEVESIEIEEEEASTCTAPR
jgi:hydrogenase nickel incorporation protein HypA/HybF